MTAAPAEIVPSTHFAEIPAKHLTPHPKNVRVDVGDVTDLAASIKTQGVLQPLVVAPLAAAKGSRSKTQQYVVIAGHRRLAAATTARLTVLPCVVREDLVGEAEQLQAMLVENGQRTDLSPVEEGDAYRVLTLDYGVPVKDLAKNIGRSQQLVRGRITLAGSSESVRTRVIAGQVPIEQAIELATFDDVPQVRDQLAKYLGTSNWSWGLEDARRVRDAERTFTAALKAVEKAGTRRVEQEPDGDVAAKLDDLAEAASEAAFTAVLDAQPDGIEEAEAKRPAVAAAAEARAAFTAEAHASCPGHAAYVRQPEQGPYGHHAGAVVLVCDQAALHANATGWEPYTAADEAAVAAQRAEENRRRELHAQDQRAALAVAATVRRRFLAGLARSTTYEEAASSLTERIVDEVVGTRGQLNAFAVVLDADVTPSPGYDHQREDYDVFLERKKAATEAQRTEVAAALAGRSVLELVGLLDAARHCVLEAELLDPDWSRQRSREYLRALDAAGHAWAPIELECLPDGLTTDNTSAS